MKTRLRSWLLLLSFSWMAALSYAQAPVPFVNQPLVPDAIAPGGPEFALTVNGTGFVPDSVVKWNKDALVTQFVSSSQLTATVPAADIAKASTAWVTVANPAPGGGTSNIVFVPVADATPSVAFQASVFSTVQSYPETTTAADFNGDGKVDLAVANRASESVSSLLGKGDGTFQPPINYFLGYEIRWVITDDFNRDGKLDLAAGGDNLAQVSILLGKGDGSFGPPTSYGTGAGTSWGAVGDFNGDGNLDLAVAGWGKVSILSGNGDGTLSAHVDYDVAGEWTWVGIGDFDRDGKLDLAVAGTPIDAVSILLGNGNGTFQPLVDYPTSGCPRSLAVADLNGDGKLDVAVDDECTSQVSVLLGNGNGTFQPRIDYPGIWNSAWIGSADFNGDGKPDLVISQYGDFGGATASLLLSNGDGTFQPPLDYPTGGRGGESGTIADFNGDGRLDLAVPNSGSYDISILLQTPLGPPAVTVSPLNLNFGNQLVRTVSNPLTVTLTNSGGATLDISGFATSPSFSQSNNCGSSLSGGQSCSINVTFRPSNVCAKTGTLTITDNAPDSPQIVKLSGVGTQVTMLPSTVDFGDQTVGTNGLPQTVTLTNHAISRALNIFAVRTSGPFAQTNNCGSTVAPGASCTLSLTFTPPRIGTKVGTLSVVHDGGGTPHQVALTGRGTTAGTE